jgi:hypothetical protein
LDDANAANAASLANARNRMITLTSTPYLDGIVEYTRSV